MNHNTVVQNLVLSIELTVPMGERGATWSQCSWAFLELRIHVLVGRSPTVPDGRSGCKPIWNLFCSFCNSTAMNIIILKWVLTDLMTCKPQDGTAILHAVLQLRIDASGSVTKPREKCCNLIGRHYSGARTNPRQACNLTSRQDGRALPNYTCTQTAHVQAQPRDQAD